MGVLIKWGRFLLSYILFTNSRPWNTTGVGRFSLQLQLLFMDRASVLSFWLLSRPGGLGLTTWRNPQILLFLLFWSWIPRSAKVARPSPWTLNLFVLSLFSGWDSLGKFQSLGNWDFPFLRCFKGILSLSCKHFRSKLLVPQASRNLSEIYVEITRLHMGFLT